MQSGKQLETVYYFMPHDDGRMTGTCCGNNIERGEEEFLRRRTHNCFVNRLRVFENKVLRRIFGPKRDKVTEGW
jgi:hypothetical protein